MSSFNNIMDTCGNETIDLEMRVTKRNGTREIVSFDKILNRIKTLGSEGHQLNINYSSLAVKVIDQLYNDIPTSKIDDLTAEQCASMSIQHSDYGTLASRIVVSNHQKNTSASFYDVVKQLYEFRDVHGVQSPLVSETLMKSTEKFKAQIEEAIDYKRDYLIDYFGFKTLERAYLMRIHKKILERPQHLWMRVALCIHSDDFEKARETYDLMSNKYFTHATPTLFNAGTPRPQLSSCYLISMQEDSIDGIYDTLKDCANISKWAGGIGLHIHNVRASGSHIRGTNGTSNGIVPMLRVFNNTARYVDQGGGKRNGSFAIYLEPWHADIEDFLEMRKNHGDEEMKARDLFYALWMPDLFMEKVQTDSDWCLFCPNEAPGLSDVYGDEFKTLYEQYESEGRQRVKVSARKLWFKILDSQMETGTPYLLYKDAANMKSNQKNLGIIKSSNLCCEIMEYSDKDETAVCNLASIGLSRFVKLDNITPQSNVVVYSKKGCKYCRLTKSLLRTFDIKFTEHCIDDEEQRKAFYEEISSKHGASINTMPQIYVDDEWVGGYEDFTAKYKRTFDFDELHRVTKVVTNNLNRVIDINFYPTTKTRTSNMRHRPIGLGVQGLADTFALMDLPFDSPKSRKLNEDIFETIYHASLEASCEIAQREGKYETFEGSPAQKGILQFDMWGSPKEDDEKWNTLKEKIKKHGLRNSLLVAPMPTASTSQILGNNECFEPFTSNIYTRRTIAGEFIIVNKHLMKELIAHGFWNEDIKNNIIANKGSIQYIEGLPQHIKDKYKIVWEIPMRSVIDMAADRGKYICQSQSMNLWVETPNYKNLTSMHFYSWKKGLKTGIYYLRRKPKHQPQQFTIEPEKRKDVVETHEDEPCEMCSG